MKKIIIAVAVVSVAALTHAASVVWSITGVTASPDHAAAAGWVAYFMDGSTYSTFSSTSADKIGEYCAANYTYTATTSSGRTGVQASATSGTYSAGDAVSAYVVIFDDADATAAGYYAATSVSSSSVPAAGNLTLSLPFATATSGWQTTAIPEPTSGLLMLLGMAGLALRRRRA